MRGGGGVRAGRSPSEDTDGEHAPAAVPGFTHELQLRGEKTVIQDVPKHENPRFSSNLEREKPCVDVSRGNSLSSNPQDISHRF